MSHIRNPPDETCTCESLGRITGRLTWIRGKPCPQHPPPASTAFVLLCGSHCAQDGCEKRSTRVICVEYDGTLWQQPWCDDHDPDTQFAYIKQHCLCRRCPLHRGSYR